MFIIYWSEILNNHKSNFCTAHQQVLSAVWAVLLLLPCWEETKFTVRTDHYEWKWVLNLAEATEAPASWQLQLTGYIFSVVYRARVKPHKTEGLSWLLNKKTYNVYIDEDVLVMEIARHWQSRGSEVTDTATNNSLTKTEKLTTGRQILLWTDHAHILGMFFSHRGKHWFSFDFDQNMRSVRLSNIDGAIKKLCNDLCSLTFHIWQTTPIPLVTRKKIVRTIHFDIDTSSPICLQMYMIRPDIARISLKWKQQLSANRGYISFPEVTGKILLRVELLVHYRRLGKATNKWLLLLISTVSWYCTLPTSNISWTHVTHLLLNNWVISSGIPDIILSDDCQEYVSKLFISLYQYPAAENKVIGQVGWGLVWWTTG